MPAASSPAVCGHATPGGGEPLPARLEAHPTREESRRQAHVQCAKDVAPAQRGKEGGLGQGLRQDAGRLGHRPTRFGVRRATQDDHDTCAVRPTALGQYLAGGGEHFVADRSTLGVRTESRRCAVVTAEGAGDHGSLAGADA